MWKFYNSCSLIGLTAFLALSPFILLGQDVGVSNILTQNSGCELSVPQSVTVEITNYSGVNINLTINLSYQVNGGPTVNQSENIALGGGATTTFTFATPISTPFPYGNNTIIASASTALDGNPSNNTFTKNFVNDQSSNGGSAGNDTSICSGTNSGSVAVSGFVGNILKWQFSTNSGASYIDIPNTTNSQTYSNLNSTRLYRAAVKNGSCPTAFSVPATITVNQIPNTPVASSNGPLCEGSNLQLNASNEPGSNYNWSGPNGFSSTLQNPTINGVSTANAGTYSVTNTLNGCTSFPGTINVAVHTIPPAVNPNSNSPVCETQNLVLTSTAISGAVYNWTGPNGFSSSQQNPNINNVSLSNAGTYSVFVTRNGCVGPTATIEVTVNAKPGLPFISSNTPVCSGDTIRLTTDLLVGGTYNWSGPNGFSSSLQNPIIPNVTAANAGNYQLTTTVNGCVSNTVTSSVNIRPTPNTPSPMASTPVCEGSSLSLSTATVAGGIYNWTGPNGFTSSNQSPTLNSVSTAASGLYEVVVTVNGCSSAPGTVNVSITPKPVTPIANSNSPLCSGQDIQLSTANVVGATYNWSGPGGFSAATQNAIRPNSLVTHSGNYGVVVTVNGCASDAGLTSVMVNQTPQQPAIASNSPICEGDELLITTPIVSGAAYAWSGPNGFSSTAQNPTITPATPSASGTYQLVVSVGACSSPPATAMWTVKPKPTAPVASSNGPVCKGAQLELYSTTVTGAAYVWSGPNGYNANVEDPIIATADFNQAGNYSVYTTLNGCASNPSTVNVVVKPIPSTPNPASNSPVCEGTTLQLVTQTVAGASYSWTGPDGFNSSLQNPTLTNVNPSQAGFYQLQLTVNGCQSAVGATNVNIKPKPSLPNATSNSPVCEGDTLLLNTPTLNGASYAWIGPNNFSSSLQNPQKNFTSLSDAGAFKVIVTRDGCVSDTGQVIVSVIAKPTLPNVSSNSPVCSGQNIQLTVNNLAGASFNWTGPAGFTASGQNVTRSNAISGHEGNYSVVATLNGCKSDPASTTVIVNTTPAQPAISTNGPICEGNTLQLNTPLVSGASYNWTGPNGFVSSIQNPLVNPATLSAGGIYQLTVSVNGCNSAIGSSSVTVNPTPPAVNVSSNAPLCVGDTLLLAASNLSGATYHWVGPNAYQSNSQNPIIPSVNTSQTGNYIVQPFFGNCGGPLDTAYILIHPTPVLPTASNNGPACEGENVQLTSSTHSGASYYWEGPNGYTSNVQNPVLPNVTMSAGGVYTLITSVNGCPSNQASTSLQVNATPSVPNPTSNAPVCQGESLQLSVNPYTGGIYNWSGPNGFNSSSQTPTINNAQPNMSGNYEVVVTVNGCTSPSGIIQATVLPTPAQPQANNDSPACVGDDVLLSANPVNGAVYQWTGPNGFVSNSQNTFVNNVGVSNAGSYLLNVTVNGCTSPNDTTIVVVIPTPVASASNSGPVCEGDTLRLMAENVSGATYSWSGPAGFTSSVKDPIIVPAALNQAGNYQLIVSVGNCSSAPAITNASVDAASSVGLILSDTTVCVGVNNGSLQATGIVGSIIQWEYSLDGGNNWLPSLNSGSNYSFVNLAQATKFRVKVKNGVCPVAISQPVTISVSSEAEAGIISAASPDPTFAVCPDDNSGSLFLQNSTGNVEFWEYSRDEGQTWERDFNLTNVYNFLNIPTTTWFRAVVSGCSTTDTSNIFVLPAHFDACNRVVIANLITPNGDGKNDTWLIADIEQYPSISVFIFNRNGKQVYSNEAYDNSWDGSFEGSPLQDGTYYYILKIGDSEEVMKGSINLLR